MELSSLIRLVAPAATDSEMKVFATGPWNITCSPQPRKSKPRSSTCRANSAVPVTDGSAVPNSIFPMLPPMNDLPSLIAPEDRKNQPVLTEKPYRHYRGPNEEATWRYHISPASRKSVSARPNETELLTICRAKASP